MKQIRKRKILHINAHMCNLEKWYSQIYFQGRDRGGDIEHRRGDTGVEGESGTNWRSSIDICALPCVK